MWATNGREAQAALEEIGGDVDDTAKEIGGIHLG